MTSRNSTRDRRDCVERHAYERGGKTFMVCHICKGEIDLAISSWEAEHPVPYALGGREVWPAHWRCHKAKTASDTSEIAKGKRMRERNLGIRRSARPIAGSKASGWKRKMSGEVERR